MPNTLTTIAKIKTPVEATPMIEVIS